MMAVLASGNGSNFMALAEAFSGHIAALVCDVEGAPVLALAAGLGVPNRCVPSSHTVSRAEHEGAVLDALGSLLEGRPLRLCVLAGYMRILGAPFLEGFSARHPYARIVNLHPAHLDEYRGARAFQRAVEGRFPRWGLSVHEVTRVLDGGDLVEADEIPVLPWDTPESLHARARPVEHALLVRSVAAILASQEEASPKDDRVKLLKT
jgi:phosphoribosylglycinamide formyltransferase-1